MIDGYLQWETQLLTRAPLLGGHRFSEEVPVYLVASPSAGSSVGLGQSVVRVTSDVLEDAPEGYRISVRVRRS